MRPHLILSALVGLFCVPAMPHGVAPLGPGMRDREASQAGRSADTLAEAESIRRGLVIQGVSVLAMDDESVRADQSVIIEGDRIVAVARPSELEVPDGAQIIDGRGKFLMPGLCDMHVHLSDPRDGLLYLANGVTTIRNLSGQPFHLDLAEAYQRGRWPGPTLVTSGPQVRLAANATTDEAASLVVEHQEQGFASVKIYGQMSLEHYRAMATVSKEIGMPLVGHVPRNLTLEEVMGVGGHREISHTEELLYSFFNRRDQAASDAVLDCVELFVEGTTYVTPTISVYREIGTQVKDLEGVLTREEMAYLPPLGHAVFGPLNKYASFDDQDLAGIEVGVETIVLATLVLHEAGVPLLLGTDAMNPSVVPGFSIHDELRELVEAGLTPFEALRCGTTTPAIFWGRQDEFGRVVAGQRADLVLLDANPLDNVGHTRQIAGVVVRGNWLSREDLDGALEEQIAGYRAERAAMSSVDPSDPEAMLETLAAAEAQPPEAFFLSVTSMYLLMNAPALASEVLDYALERTPESAMLHNRKAEVVAALGDREAAQEHYRRALELEPTNAIARRGVEDEEDHSRTHK